MHCQSCQTAILDAPERCPACGGSLDLAPLSETTPPSPPDPRGAAMNGGANGTSAHLDATAPEAITALIVAQATPAPMPLVRRLPGLTTLAWRQPAVRAVVKTGASTLALSIALNAARRALISRAGHPASPSLPSLLLETLGKGERQRARRLRREAMSDIVVEEVFIYARRVTRP